VSNKDRYPPNYGRASTPSTPETRDAPGRPWSACGSMRGESLGRRGCPSCALPRPVRADTATTGARSSMFASTPTARSGCVSEAHHIVRRAIRIADDAPLRARFTSPCDGGVRQSARLKTRQSQRRADLGPVMARSVHDLRSGSTKSDAAGSPVSYTHLTLPTICSV